MMVLDRPCLLSDAVPKGTVCHGRATILLVDDDDMMCMVVREILERDGYQVLVAPDGLQALLVSQHFEGPIHLLLTDVVMPRMTGWEVARLVLLQRPSTRVVYMSGYSELVLFGQRLARRDHHFLAKPFMKDGLLRTVRGALADSPVPQ